MALSDHVIITNLLIIRETRTRCYYIYTDQGDNMNYIVTILVEKKGETEPVNYLMSSDEYHTFFKNYRELGHDFMCIRSVRA